MLFMAVQGDSQKFKNDSIKAVPCLKGSTNDVWTIDSTGKLIKSSEHKTCSFKVSEYN